MNQPYATGGVVDPGQPFAALHAPTAMYSWECQTILLRTVQDTGRIPLRWNRPVEIIGMRPSVVANAIVGGGLLVPTAEDIVCAVSANQQDKFTNRLEFAAAVGAAESFVVLAALGVQTPRLTRIQLTNESPQLDVTFRWRTNLPGTPTYEDANIALTLFCRYLS